MPRHDEIFFFRASATCTVESGTGRRVEGEGKEVQGFDEVGDERAGNTEVEETADVYDECQAENYVEDSLP